MVSDTSPISYLVITGHEEGLPILYGEVLIPEAASRELGHSEVPAPVSEWTGLKGAARGWCVGTMALCPSGLQETDRPPETTQPSLITSQHEPMLLRATLRDDNTLELPEDAPRLAQTNTPLRVVDLGGGTFVVTETEPQIPQIASEFRGALAAVEVSPEQLLDHLSEVKRELADETDRP